jgi:two-component sensor histidine kinase
LTAEALAHLHAIVDGVTVVSSLSALTAIGWYMTRMRGRVGGFAGATAVIAVFVMALAATRVASFVVARSPGADHLYLVEAFAAAVTFLASVAMWPLVPRLLTMPTRCELVAVNRRLEEEQEARQALVEEMRALNEALERRVAERTRELELERRRFEIALSGSTIAVAEQDRDLRYTWMYNPPATLRGVDPVGRLPEEILPASTAAAQGAVKRRVMATGRAERFEVPMPSADAVAWYEGRIEPLIEAGEVVGVVTVSVDITRHKEHESEMRDVLRELTHRSKNLLAVVQGIARQSGAGRPDEASFLAVFNGRLQALSRVHEILVEELWRGVGLRDLIERERAAGRADDAGSFAITTPDRRLSPEAAQNFALALHELFVDARSLPDRSGRTEIGWQEADGRFVFTWDRPGPPGEALRAGFGRVFLERHLPRSVGGLATLTIDETATRYRLVGPLTALDPT